MTLIEIIQILSKIAETQPDINATGEGDIYEFFNADPQAKYATFFLTQGQHNSTEEFDNYNLTLFYVDRLKSDESNKLPIQSAGKECLGNIIRTFCNEFEAETETIQYQPFTQRFADMCAGVYATVTFSVMKESVCDENFGYAILTEKPKISIKNQTKAISIDSNGHYTVTYDGGYTGLEKVDIDVDVMARQPILENLTVGENGVYLPDEKIDGWNRVEVAMPEPVYDSVFIEDDGIYTPEAPVDAFNKVEVRSKNKVQVNPAFATITKNVKDFIIAPEPPYNCIKSAIVTVQTPEVRNKEFTATFNENGEHYFVIPEGYSGYNPLYITIDVPQPVVNLDVIGYRFNDNDVPSADYLAEPHMVEAKRIYDEWNPENTDATDLFKNSIIKYLPKINCRRVINASHMFDGANSIRYIPFGSVLPLMPDVTNASYMFANLTNPTLLNSAGNIVGLYIENASHMFENTTFDNSIPNLYLPSCKDASYMFAGIKNVSTINSLGLETENMSHMFENSKINLVNSDRLSFNKATNTSYMFAGAKNLDGVIINGDCFKIENASHMFDGCERLMSLSGFKNLRVSLNLSDTNIRNDGIYRGLFSNIYDFRKDTTPPSSTPTITISRSASISEETRKIATDKGWSVY